VRSALLYGASGLVGGELLRGLLASTDYVSVCAPGRRPLPVTNQKLTSPVVDLGVPAQLEAISALPGLDVFCCLGTTIKKAGSQEAFRKVDHDYPLAAARAAQAAGARRFIVCTAVGADAKSTVFYNRVKGELEDALRALRFPGGLKVLHPSLLLGERGESRPGERVAIALLGGLRGVFGGPLAKWKPIEAREVAQAMLHAALREPAGDAVYEGRELFRLAGV
jgi:uncharacterized protein YbjT (DUF2867 family)